MMRGKIQQQILPVSPLDSPSTAFTEVVCNPQDVTALNNPMFCGGKVNDVLLNITLLIFPVEETASNDRVVLEEETTCKRRRICLE